jgi:hypothetical protein
MEDGMRIISAVFLVACTGEAPIEKIPNTSPSVQITSHEDGIELQEGYSVQFRAQLSDDDNEFEELNAAWYANDSVICDWTSPDLAGSSSCDIAIGVSDTIISVEVRDPQGAGSRDELDIVVIPTDAPSITMTSPLSGSTYYGDQLISFSAVISDSEDETNALISTWSSNIDGDLLLDTEADSNGEIQDYRTLSEGEHAIELRVEDSSGKVTTESVVITVGGPNSIPQCEIIEPEDSSAGVEGENITFRGQVSDEDILPTELSIEWSSDKDGTLGTSTANSDGRVTFPYSGLSNNTHVITLQVSDEVDATCIADILYTVGNAPEVTLEAPLDGDVYNVGESIVFRASVTDAEDTPNNISISWVSSLDGPFSTQGVSSSGISQFTNSSLTAGVHTIVVTVTDSDGLYSDSLVTFRVNNPPTAPTVQISPSAPTTSDDLIAIALGASDADGDPITYSYEWYQNGLSTTHTTSTLSASNTAAGEIWLIRVTPNDGYVDGTYSEEFITIANTAPTLSSVSVTATASSVYNDDTLTCAATVTDPDETLTPSYLWDVNGIYYSGANLDLGVTNGMPGDTVTCTVSVTDSAGESASSTGSIAIDNRTPVLSTAVINPSSANNSGLLTCVATATDADGENITLDYIWTNITQGTTIGSSNPLQLDNTLALNGDTLSCTATATDESMATDTSSVNINIFNSAPNIISIAITPDPPTALDSTLTCTVGTYDADGEPVSVQYEWFVNSSLVSTGSTLSNTYSAGTTIQCEATPFDGVDYGTSQNVAVTVQNSAPVADIPVFTSSTIYTDDTITATTTISDADGDTVQLQYDWYVNSILVQTSSSNTLDGTAYFDKNDSVYVTVIPNDGTVNGSSQTSGSLVIANTPPDTPIISVVGIDSNTGGNTSTPFPGTDDLLCEITSSSDQDGDTLTYSFAWTILGVPWSGAVNTTNYSSDGIPGSETTAGQTWGCEVTATDSSSESTTSVEEVIDIGCEDGTTANCPGLSCQDLLDLGHSTGDGYYYIDPDGSGGFEVYCDMSNHGGGWTQAGTIQRNGSTHWNSWSGGYWTDSNNINYPGGGNSSSDYKNPAWYRMPMNEMMVLQTDGGSYYVVANGGPNQTLAYIYTNYMIGQYDWNGCGYLMSTVDSSGNWNRVGLAGCSDNSNENTLFQLDSGNAGGYYHNRSGCSGVAEWGSWGNCSPWADFGGAQIYIK